MRKTVVSKGQIVGVDESKYRLYIRDLFTDEVIATDMDNWEEYKAAIALADSNGFIEFGSETTVN